MRLVAFVLALAGCAVEYGCPADQVQVGPLVESDCPPGWTRPRACGHFVSTRAPETCEWTMAGFCSGGVSVAASVDADGAGFVTYHDRALDCRATFEAGPQ